MKYMLVLIITGSVLLSACASTTPTTQHGGTSGGHQQGSTQRAKNLIVRDRSTDNEISFSVRDGNETFTDYGISHTKEMHLIVVRDDLQNFRHLHPERNAEGVWRVAFTPPVGGTYWRYADFVDTDAKTYTIRFDRTYAGDPAEHGLKKNFETAKTADGYRFELPSVPTVGGDTLSFTYFIEDAQGERPSLEEYLGAIGHSVLISPSGDFVHAHATVNEYGDPEFLVSIPKENFYRAFTQFKIKGKVLTVSFDWKRNP